MKLPIKNIYNLLKATTTPERLALGGGVVGGGFLMGKFLDNAHKNSMWGKIKDRYWHEMSSWDDPKKIFDFVINTSRELSGDPETIWVIMKQINEQGGVNYAVAKSLIDMESGVVSSKQQRSEGIGSSMSALYEKTSSASKYIPSLLLGGALAGGAGVLGTRMLSSMHSDGAREIKWMLFKTKKGSLIAGWEDEAKEYFNLLYNRTPFLTEDDDIVYSFIKHMRDQGGADISTLTDLISLSQKKEKINSGKAKAVKAITDVVGDLSIGMFGDAL